MLDGRAAIFISCSEGFKVRTAYPFRDFIEYVTNGRAIIVSDAPMLGSDLYPDQKVETYLDKADVFIALCTPDNELVGGIVETRQNIIDEIRRALNKGNLRDRICIFKESRVRLPSNLNVVYEALDPAGPARSFPALARQLATWGWREAARAIESTPNHSPTASVNTPPPGLDWHALRPDDYERTKRHVLSTMEGMTKPQQREYVERAREVAGTAERWEDRAIAGHVLEALAEFDPWLVPPDLIDQMTRHADFSVRSGAAMILFTLAERLPGAVPLDLVTRLARPADEDWYVYRPAIAALEQLALSRRDARDVLVRMAAEAAAGTREAAVEALYQVAKVKPELVPLELPRSLERDDSSTVRTFAQEIDALARSVSAAQRQHPYGFFSPF